MSTLVAAAVAALVLTAMVPRPAASQRVADNRSQLVWFDRTGQRLGVVGELQDFGNLELSPDGTQVAVAVRDPAVGSNDLWLYDTDGPGRRRFTSGVADENWMIWAPDGESVAFNSFGPEGLVLRRAEATNPEPSVLVMGDSDGKWPVSWSPDGQHLLVVKNDPATGNDIWVLPSSGGAARPFRQTTAQENWAAFSPDGRWVAFSADVSGVPEVYVAAFPAGGPSWLVSEGGGIQARWRRDGRELFYLALDGTITAVSIDGRGQDLEVADPEPLFNIRVSHPPYHAFDVSPDGQRFLVNWLLVAPGEGSIASRGTGVPRTPSHGHSRGPFAPLRARGSLAAASSPRS